MSYRPGPLAIAILITVTLPAFPAFASAEFEDPARMIRVIHAVLSDNGDNDGWADSNETVTMRLRLFNASGIDLTNVRATLLSSDPRIECLLQDSLTIGAIAAGETPLTDGGFEFKVKDVSRAAPYEAFEASFQIEFEVDEVAGPLPSPQTLTLPLDLDVSGGDGPTTFFEGFESGLGSFVPMPIDDALNPPATDPTNHAAGVANSDGARCQTHDPDWIYSNSYGSSAADICYPNPTNAGDRYWWHTTTDRAFSGTASLAFNHNLGDGLGFTTPTAQLEAIRSGNPINLSLSRVCSLGSDSCSTDSDCPTGESCLPPTLSFKHQVSFIDHRTSNPPPGQTLDRGMMSLQVADAAGVGVGDWIRLEPYVNSYDSQAAASFFGCFFDPTDDGNTEEDFFDPTDPMRRFGPSSTCFPVYTYADQGSTDRFGATMLGDAWDGPTLRGETGRGSWVEPRVDLDRFRGQRVRLRFLTSGKKQGGFLTWEALYSFNPDSRDDGWFIDDVTIHGALTVPAQVAVDTNDNVGIGGDEDLDGDGLGGICDLCPSVPDPGRVDTDGDGFGDGCDCEPTLAEVYPGASEVNDGIDNQCPGDYGYGQADEAAYGGGFHDPGNPDLYSWPTQPGATGYQVARARSATFDADCTLFATGDGWIVDPELPDPDGLFCYLYRASTPFPGSWGVGSDGLPRSVDCP